MSKNKITDLIIDAASEKILFKLISKNKTYTNEHENSRKNFDKFAILLFKFMNKNKVSFKIVDKVLINLGPGKFTSLRISLSIAKAISFANKVTLVGFYSKDLINKNYKNLIKLAKNKSLIKPIYSS